MITYSPDNKTKAGKLLVLTLYQGIISIAGILITSCCYIRTVKRLRRLAGEIDGLLDVNLKRLFWYPAVMSVIYIPSLMDNYWAIYTNISPDWLIILHFGLTHLVGFFNFVVYGWQRKFYYNRDRKVGRQSDQQVEVHTPQEDNSASISLDEELLQKKRLR